MQLQCMAIPRQSRPRIITTSITSCSTAHHIPTQLFPNTTMSASEFLRSLSDMLLRPYFPPTQNFVVLRLPRRSCVSTKRGDTRWSDAPIAPPYAQTGSSPQPDAAPSCRAPSNRRSLLLHDTTALRSLRSHPKLAYSLLACGRLQLSPIAS